MSACACDGGQLRPLDEALAELLARAPRPPACESLALERALGRVLGEDLLAPMDLPHWDNSAMDGYALCSAGLPRSGGSLTVGARIAAGDTRGMSLPLGQAARIFTGAPLPTGADCVVPQELCVVDGERVQLPPVSAGQHVRRRGEELRRGAPVLRAGQRLRPQELGLLASLGVATLSVRRRLRIGLLSSGDELREPGQTLLAGQIYNANRYCIGALLRGLGFEVHDEEVLADELVASRDALSLAASEWDALVTSGGVSVGEEDHLKRAIAELGEVNLWRLAIQPGKPFAFGSVAGKPWLGLPGNPAAALVTALLVARPFLLRQQGLFDVVPRPLALPAAFDWPQPRARRQYLRARLDERGRVEIHPQQGSAMLLAASWADGLAVIERGATLGVGDAIDFLPFSALMA
ncbi:molybdopterin molybdotransferase MoeA [Pseudomonas aeruginosa]|nr:molybdopterin molybdotransferase MoeA [Pseudomonas aeruginosa]